MSYNLTLLGCGKMGGAMLSSWLNNDIAKSVHVIDPNQPDDLSDTRISHSKRIGSEPIHSDLFIVAVKPQILIEATKDITGNLSIDTPVLSIAAGQSIESLERIFGSNHPIIRCMPNTPAAVGKGMSVAIGNEHINHIHKKCAQDVLECSGKATWIENEALMDTVTALSGSGPAYVFYLIEVLTKAGETLGLDADTAMTLARQTVIGASALADHEQTTTVTQLRKNVTSPGGTTEAALEVLMDGRLQDLMNEALLAAQTRSKELNTK